MQYETIHIQPKKKITIDDFKEIYNYKTLLFLFVKRNIFVKYKQTILGPMWLILNPIITVCLYALVFGNIAGMSTDGTPVFAFYLCSNALWSYFSLCLTQTSNTFVENSNLMSKIYFPRLIVPMATVITGMVDLLVQIGMLVIVLIIYYLCGVSIQITSAILLIPLIIIQISLLGLGCGIIIASLTTRYRDLLIAVSFGAQLWMYASPVVYSVSQIPVKYQSLYMLNPIAPIITMWRYAFLGCNDTSFFFWGISWITTIILLAIGYISFNKMEKNFVDTI